jgi:arylsulfatase A-like enzyme
MVSNYDFLPTVLSYLGLEAALEGVTPRSPGRDFSPVLLGEEIPWDNRVYYEMEYVRAIRTAQFKYVHRLEGPFELYDLQHDPFEKFNLYGQPSHAERQRELEQQLDKFFGDYAEPKYDLYHGGGSKASLLTLRTPRTTHERSQDASR